jgi:hypothetical protein
VIVERNIMCVLFTRKAVVPVWIIVFGLVFLFSPPTGFPTAVLLLVAGVFVASAMTLLLWKFPVRPALAPVPYPIDVAPAIIARPHRQVGRQRWTSRR